MIVSRDCFATLLTTYCQSPIECRRRRALGKDVFHCEATSEIFLNCQSCFDFGDAFLRPLYVSQVKRCDLCGRIHC
jgi:hypothetical protein